MSQNLQNVVKFQKFQLENLVDFEKCCKTHILLQKSEPIQPTTSNILPKFANRRSLTSPTRRREGEPAPRDRRRGARHGLRGARGFRESNFSKMNFRKMHFSKNAFFEKCIFEKFCKFLAGSFSAVSKRNFARKYAFDSIFQSLQDLHPFAPLQSQNYRKKSV